MSTRLASVDKLQKNWGELLKLRKESASIRSMFNDKELDISDYTEKSTLSLLMTEFFTIVIGAIIASLILVVSTFIGLVWLVGIFYVIVLIGLLFLFFLPIASISGIFFYLTYIDEMPPNEAAYICIGLFALYRLMTILARKKKAVTLVNNEDKIFRLILEIEQILTDEMIPIAHRQYIVSLETIMDDADINFLPEAIIESTFEKEAEEGRFEEVSSFKITENASNKGKKAKIFKSLLNTQPSNEFVEIIELDIS